MDEQMDGWMEDWINKWKGSQIEGQTNDKQAGKIQTERQVTKKWAQTDRQTE